MSRCHLRNSVSSVNLFSQQRVEGSDGTASAIIALPRGLDETTYVRGSSAHNARVRTWLSNRNSLRNRFSLFPVRPFDSVSLGQRSDDPGSCTVTVRLAGGRYELVHHDVPV